LEITEGSDVALINNVDLLNIIAELLEVEVEDAQKAFCARVVAARGEVMQKSHTAQEAVHGRDALAKVSSFLHVNYSLN